MSLDTLEKHLLQELIQLQPVKGPLYNANPALESCRIWLQLHLKLLHLKLQKLLLAIDQAILVAVSAQHMLMHQSMIHRRLQANAANVFVARVHQLQMGTQDDRTLESLTAKLTDEWPNIRITCHMVDDMIDKRVFSQRAAARFVGASVELGICNCITIDMVLVPGSANSPNSG